MKVTSKNILRVVWVVSVFLMIPLIAMQFSSEVNWRVSDFVIMGTVLFAVGLAYELIAQQSRSTRYKVAVGVGLLGAFLLFWVNGAVGIIGNEGQPANLLFGLVFLVGIVGAILSRLNPLGMSRTLITASATQMLVPALALLIWPPPTISWSPGILGVFLLSAFFAALFFISGQLFKRAI